MLALVAGAVPGDAARRQGAACLLPFAHQGAHQGRLEPPEGMEGVLPQVAEQGAHCLVPREELQAGHLEDGGPRQEGQLGHAGPRRLLKHTN